MDVLKELLQPEVAVEQIAAAHSVRRAPHSCSYLGLTRLGPDPNGFRTCESAKHGLLAQFPSGALVSLYLRHFPTCLTRMYFLFSEPSFSLQYTI